MLLRAEIGVRYDWCLYFQNGRCGACIKRCPGQMQISKDGHDKQRCLDYEDESVAKYWPSHIDEKRISFSAAGYASPRYRVVIGDHSLLVF